MKTKVIAVSFCILLLLVVMAILLFYGIFPLDTEAFPGYSGHLVIPSIGIDVPCIQAQSESNGSIYFCFLVNQRNCAAMIWCSKGLVIEGVEIGDWIIADHNYQGFSAINDCAVGDTASFIYADDSVQKYTVIASFTGHNAGNDLTDDDYNSISTKNPGGLILYTCLDSTENVRIVFLQPVEE